MLIEGGSVPAGTSGTEECLDDEGLPLPHLVLLLPFSSCTHALKRSQMWEWFLTYMNDCKCVCLRHTAVYELTDSIYNHKDLFVGSYYYQKATCHEGKVT